MKNLFAKISILLFCFGFSPLSDTRHAFAETYLDPKFKAEVLAELPGEIIIGGTLAIGPGGDWGEYVYVLTTPSFPNGTAPVLAKIWRIDRHTSQASVLTTFPSRFDQDAEKRALAFYTSGRIPPAAVITGALAFDKRNLLGPVDTNGNPGLYVTSSDSGKIFKVAPDGSIQLIHNLRAALNLSLYDDPTGITFNQPGEWQSGLYVVITSEGYPNSWRLIKYSSLAPLTYSLFASGVGGGGSMSFAPMGDGAFGADLYILSGRNTYHIHRMNKSAQIISFSNFDSLSSSTGITFSEAGSFEGSLYVGYGRVDGTTGNIFKILADGTSRLFASGIGGQGMIFESADALLVSGNTQIIRIIKKNNPPVANAGPDQTVAQTSCAGASVMLDGSGSSDPDGDTLTYTWINNGSVIATGVSPTVALSYGSHTITLTVDDGKGGTASDDVMINVADTTAPALNVSLNPNTLWPPNHKYVTITPSITVSDACVETTTVLLISASSNEPDNGLGDGDTANDIVVNSDGTLLLRAERSGKGNGRVYTITYQATDAAGNTTTSSATVTVPHNQ